MQADSSARIGHRYQPSLESGHGPEGGALSRAKKASLRPRSNSKSISLAANPDDASSSSTSSSTWEPSTLSHRTTGPPSSLYLSPSQEQLYGPNTPTFQSAFPVTPPLTPGISLAQQQQQQQQQASGPALWQTRLAVDGSGLGISTSNGGGGKGDGVKSWVKGAAQGTTVWLVPDRNGKRRASDGLLSPQDDGYKQRFGSRADGGRTAALRRWVRSKGPRTPMARLVTVVVALLLTFSLYQLLPPSTPPLPKTPVARHVPHAVPFRQTYNKIPEAAEYDSLRIHPADAARSSKGGAGASRTAVPARRGAKWHWKDAREELGCLLHYVTSSEAAALPDLNTDEPLDPELILDFNPYSPASGSRSGRRMVEQTVDDFWNGKSTLGGGKVVIVGKDSDPAALSIRAMLSDLEIETDGIFISVEGRSDTYRLHRLLERIIEVPRLPALVIGGKPVGSYLEMLSMQFSGELYRLLDEAGVKYQRPESEEDYDAEDDYEI